MRMKVLAAVLLALTVAALGACSSDGEDEGDETATDDSVVTSTSEAEVKAPDPIEQPDELAQAWLDLAITGGRCTVDFVANGGRLTTTAELDATGGIDALVEGFGGRGPGGTDEVRLVREGVDAAFYVEVDGQWVEVRGDDADAGLVFLVDPLVLLSGLSAEELDEEPATEPVGGTTYTTDEARLADRIVVGDASGRASFTTDADGHLLLFEHEYESENGPGALRITCEDHGASPPVTAPPASVSSEEAFGT